MKILSYKQALELVKTQKEFKDMFKVVLKNVKETKKNQ